jgi:hypothetical protein
MTFVKQTLKNTASLLLAVWIIGTAYAAISTVSSGDPFTADSWNAIVNKLNNTDTNSTDLVTKSYVDSSISANSGGGWSNCETHIISKTTSSQTITCSTWKSIRNHAYTCHQYWSSYWDNCWITSITTTSLTGNGDNYYSSASGNSWSAPFSASIICCDD